MSEFHSAVGQFVNYRLVLSQVEPDRMLYLAVSDYVFANLFSTEFGVLAIKAHQLKLIVFDEILEVVKQWID